MITRIYVPKEAIRRDRYFSEHLLDALILLDKIDTNFHNIKLNKINWEENPDSPGCDYYIDYTLEKNIIWNELEECEERLKIGL